MRIFAPERHKVFFRVIFAVFFLAISLIGILACAFSISEAGICISEGRMIGEEEHRQRLLKSLINRSIENSETSRNIDGDMAWKAGIIYSAEKYDLVKVIRAAKDNEKNLEDNFGIEIISPAERNSEALHFTEPFVLVDFYDGEGGAATFMPSVNIKKLPKSKSLTESISLAEKLQGFGNSFYLISHTFVRTDCCNNKRYARSEEEYKHSKGEAYRGTLNSISKGYATHENVAPASNCGEILTEESDNGMDLRIIKWITNTN